MPERQVAGELLHTWPLPLYDLGSTSGLEGGRKGGLKRVLTSTWDTAASDSIEDQARQVLRDGKSLSEFVNSLVEHERTELRCEGARLVMGELLGDRNIRLAAHSLAFACGYQSALPLPGIARLLHVSKQAVQQRVAVLRERLGLVTPNARTAEACTHMSEAYHSRRNACQQGA